MIIRTIVAVTDQLVTRTFFHGCIALAALSMALAVSVAQAQADDTPTVMIVLDGSGSMWGKLGDGAETKLALSQSTLTEVLAAPNPKLKLGFSSFGHRRAGNCSDAQVIVPPAAGTAPEIVARIAKHNPRGKGPLSLALRKTAAAVSPDVPSTVVMIHDGYDNCRQDPCKVADEIAASHPKMTIHTIGLDLPESAGTAMSCLARKTGGKLRIARTAAELKTAVQSAMALAMLRPPKEIARTKKTKPKLAADAKSQKDGPSRVRLVATLKSKPDQALQDVHWRIVSPASPKVSVVEKQATELATPVPPGRYIVQARAGLAESEQQLTVGERGEVQQRLDVDAGVVTFDQSLPAQFSAGGTEPVFLTLRPAQPSDSEQPTAPIWIGSQKPAMQLVVPTGTFELNIERGQTKKMVPVVVEAGDVTSVNTTLDGGLLVLDSVTPQAATDMAAQAAAGVVAQPAVSQTTNVTYVISTDDPSTPGGRRELARSASPQAEFLLQPGTVYAEARLGHARRERRFAIGDSQVVRHQFQFDVGRVTLNATLGDRSLPNTTPVQFTVYALTAGGNRAPLAVTSKQTPTLTLPSGRYAVEVKIADVVMGQSAPMDLVSGAALQISVPLDAGQVRFNINAAATQRRFTRYQIRKIDGGKVVWRGRATKTAATLLQPGQYRLEARNAPERQRNFTVQAGGVTVVDLPSQL